MTFSELYAAIHGQTSHEVFQTALSQILNLNPAMFDCWSEYEERRMGRTV